MTYNVIHVTLVCSLQRIYIVSSLPWLIRLRATGDRHPRSRDDDTTRSGGCTRTWKRACPRPGAFARVKPSSFQLFQFQFQLHDPSIAALTLHSLASHIHHTTPAQIPLTHLQHHLTVPCCLIIIQSPHSGKSFDWTPRAAIPRPFKSAAHDQTTFGA